MQAENERREAERRAKEEAERKAAAEREQQRKQRAAAAAAAAKAGGGSRKAGGQLGDYRAELDDFEGAEEDEWEELEAEKVGWIKSNHGGLEWDGRKLGQWRGCGRC